MSSVPELLLCLDTAIWQLGAKPFELMLPCLVTNEADTAQCRQDVCSCHADKSVVVSLHRVQSASGAQLTQYEMYFELSAIEGSPIAVQEITLLRKSSPQRLANSR